MKTRYFIVSGDTAKPIPDRMQDESTHSLDLDDDTYAKACGPHWFKVVNGEPVVKTEGEFTDTVLKPSAKQNAIQLYENLKSRLVVDFEGDQIDLSDSFAFDYQMRKKSDDIRVLVKDAKSKTITKAKASQLELIAAQARESLLGDRDADIQDIEDGVDLSCPRLNARLQG